MSNYESTKSGSGLLTLLTVLFIGLKLTGHIGWSWVWVLSPLWLSTVVLLGIVSFVIFIYFTILLIVFLFQQVK